MIYDTIMLLAASVTRLARKCTGKGIGRQGVVSKHRNSFLTERAYALLSYALTCAALTCGRLLDRSLLGINSDSNSNSNSNSHSNSNSNSNSDSDSDNASCIRTGMLPWRAGYP